MKSVMINLSWKCDLAENPKTACPYCWVRMAGLKRDVDTFSAAKWLKAIEANISRSVILDFVGGEPTIFKDFHWLIKELSSKYGWAMTSNMNGPGWLEFALNHVKNCVSWTASYHHRSSISIEEFVSRCRQVIKGYPLSVNIVRHPSHDADASAEKLTHLGLKTFVSPFEDIEDLNCAGELPLSCNGGLSHVVIDPNGNIYRCLTQLRRTDRPRWIIGNLFAESVNWPRKRMLCFLPCDQFYNLDCSHATKDMWGLDVREIETEKPTLDFYSYQQSFNPNIVS